MIYSWSWCGCPTIVFGTDLIMVSAVFNTSIYFLYMQLGHRAHRRARVAVARSEM